MERFVGAIVAGGLAVVLGTWLLHLLPAWSLTWGAGMVLVGGGVVGFAWAIGSQVEWKATLE